MFKRICFLVFLLSLTTSFKGFAARYYYNTISAMKGLLFSINNINFLRILDGEIIENFKLFNPR